MNAEAAEDSIIGGSFKMTIVTKQRIPSGVPKKQLPALNKPAFLGESDIEGNGIPKDNPDKMAMASTTPIAVKFPTNQLVLQAEICQNCGGRRTGGRGMNKSSSMSV